MTALAANKLRSNKAHERCLNSAPVNAGSKIFVGAYLCREAGTGVVIPGADAAGLIPLGVVVEQEFPDDPDVARTAALDNTDGADGSISGTTFTRCVRYDQVGEYAFVVSGGTPKVGQVAYLVDDATVSPAITTHGIVAGVFTRPDQGGLGWLVDISFRGHAAVGRVSAAVAALTGTPGTADGAVTALPTLTDTPASADALRDDLTTNWKPAIDNNIADLQTTVNALAAALLKAGITA